MSLRKIGLVCAVLATAACGGAGTPDVPSAVDVPNARMDVPPGADVPNAPRDVPNGVDMPNAPVDVPSDVPTVIADTGVCPMGTAVCGMNGCVNLQSDNMNCGACGTACGAGQSCNMGMCACNAGTMMCGAACVNPMTDSMNCGACGTTCPGGQMCVAGACRIDCPAPGTICGAGGMMSCLNLQTDVNNCGACGTGCMAQNGVANCAAGACGVASCNAGFANCDNAANNGCEVNTGNSIANCGACGTVCAGGANAAATCAAGACGLTCSAGFGNCNNMAADGCEVNLNSTIANCGACGRVCAAANGTPSCSMGACGVAACNAGFGNCDGNAANGCEINTNTDNNNCGACGRVCGAGQSCNAGVCQGAMAGSCIGNPRWTPVTCTTPSWVWSMDRARGMTVAAANTARVLASSNTGPAPGGAQGMCSLDGTGYVSTQTFTMAACNSDWYHLGGSFTGNCGGHDGELYRLLAVGPNDCYDYPNYRPIGPQNNVPVATVTGGGWTECYRDLYNNGATSLATIQAACNGDNVMVACRATGSATLQLLAQAPRTDVFFNTGDNNNNVRLANATNWYFSTSYSMGFVNRADAVSRSSCDTGGASQPGQRLCFHTGAGNINGGYRCGADLGLNASAAFERVFYHTASYRPVGPQNNVPVATVTGGGWTQCHIESYTASTPLATIQANCNRANVMVACRTNGNATLQLLAQAPRADVFFDTGNDIANRSSVHNANGTAWYYSNAWSMGFARQGDLVNRFSCDFPDMAGFPGSTVNPGLRLCIHTSGNNTSSGWRCGADTSLGGTHERVFYHSN